MQFYVPDWDDWIDRDYDFTYDEPSAIARTDRETAHLWDFFGADNAPLDGVLISKRQLERNPTRANRLLAGGIYDDPQALPASLPSISDCGAWGYKSLPFPPYENTDILAFYEELGVSVGVTIDHLVLSSDRTSRLYLDARALPEGFSQDDLPAEVREYTDVLIDSWPQNWPAYVSEADQRISTDGSVESFDVDLFDQPFSMLLPHLRDHPHAVYRADDTTYRYERTLSNAQELKRLYDAGSYSFRLMVAIQGWSPHSYARATEEVLEMGYQYLGIGGVAGTREGTVERIVDAVGNRVSAFERTNQTRVDSHVFGFAKPGAFDVVGRSGISSFDSASMLRRAWTGDQNYRFGPDETYTALRIRYPDPGQPLTSTISHVLRSRELVIALQAFDARTPIHEAVDSWYERTVTALDELERYLRGHKHDARYETDRIREQRENFRAHYPHADVLEASIGEPFVRALLERLRADDPLEPLDFSVYSALVARAKTVLTDWTPTATADTEVLEASGNGDDPLEHVWPVVESYATFVGDEANLDAYRELLEARPWKQCDCFVCEQTGIDVAIFRGNERNRRRGFHNMRQFYDEFEAEFPDLVVATSGSTSLPQYETIEGFLRAERSDFWEAVHDLPVVDIGVVTGAGIHFWWEETPSSVSFDPLVLQEHLQETLFASRDLYLETSTWTLTPDLIDVFREFECPVRIFASPVILRRQILERLKYNDTVASWHRI